YGLGVKNISVPLTAWQRCPWKTTSTPLQTNQQIKQQGKYTMTDFWTVMSQYWSGEFWSTWAMVIITINYGSILFLFLWGPWVDIPKAEDGTTGHVWSHGNIREA